MGFRFRKSFKIAPGVRVNFGKKSTGISIGNRGGGVSFNTKTGTRVRASIPGTGISYSSKVGGKKKRTNNARKGRIQRTYTQPSTQRKETVRPDTIGGVKLNGVVAALVIAGIGTFPMSVHPNIWTFLIFIVFVILGILWAISRFGNAEKQVQENIQYNIEHGLKSYQSEDTDEVPSVPIDESQQSEHSPAVQPSPALAETPERTKLIKEDFSVAGVSYCKENIMKLACVNSDWRKHTKTLLAENKHTVYRYNFINKPVKLLPEPSNEHDPNAILVQIAGEKVGYISREENVHVADILGKRSVKYISAFITGGDYKVISDASSMEKGTQDIAINIRIAYS